MEKFSLIMPMYNEEAIVEKVVLETIASFDQKELEYELVLVKNGCKDKTGEIIDTLAKRYSQIKPILIPINLGYGWGVIQGLNAATSPIIGYVDGDGQVPADDILRVLNRFEDQNVVMCKGIRYNRGDGWKRIFASFSFNALFKMLFLSTARDINGKPKFFKKEIYQGLDLKSKDWFVDPEIMIKVLHKGYKAQEIEVHFDERKNGKSNVSIKTVTEFGKNLIKWRVALWTKKKL
ncbi:glycosyltransferase family 2 protein [Candidatus Woesearchaeota archaeon]|nr:glycosyltransferase family 2 protein [Candidatus Woesearchaeota archaeon]